ncbi:MAG: hypothetical protein R3250_18250, partial [Melioribacteraceae bacterium]|nr:hypothetical protein [Melioribacteraceae bacterium]
MNLRSIIILYLITIGSLFTQTMPPSMEDSKAEPIKYTGKINTAKEFYDGKLPHAVGVQHFQVFRSNRSFPAEPGVYGWTYNHQPYIA